MDQAGRGAVWIIATGVIAAGLYFLREPLTIFALAVILWLVIDGAANAIRRRVHIPKIWAWAVAVVTVLGIAVAIFYVLFLEIGDLASHAKNYEASLNAKVADVYHTLNLQGAPPTMGVLMEHVEPTALLAQTAAALQGVAGSTVFILILVGFLASSGPIFTKKLDAIFTNPDQRGQVRAIIASIRGSMERYMWVQTVMSLLDTVLTFATLRLIGLDNALFWAFLIFFLNFIPTVGSIVAVALPTAFAVVQFPSVIPVIEVAFGVGFWQFAIGNFVQPRLTGESLNLSTVIVLFALTVWGVMWGIAGAFLSSPLTVMLMIVLAQFPDTKWIAIMLSADGKPTVPSSLQTNPVSDQIEVANRA